MANGTAGISLMNVGGSFLDAFGALFQGEAAARAAEFNAAVERQNAQISLQNAAEAEKRFRRMSRKRMGAARAARGASGVTLEGSALDALAESAMQEELDALTIRYQGELRARDHRIRAQMSQYEADVARTSSYIDALGAII